ncbi:hypothetical protein [Flavobacterium sp.]|uniref:hypothetical protein n=1 Tax=Flavobacterium sp. TaxID=239 RepID=UPI003D6AEF3D
MKKYLLFICLMLVVSCKKTENTNEINSENKTVLNSENKTIETVSETNTALENEQNTERPKQSRVIKSKFDLKLLYRIWTSDPEGPHADFDLSKKSFYVVDYDGNADMPYIINEDTIKVFYNDFVSVGIIKNVTKDSLKIDWDNNGLSNYVEWKN